MPKNNAHVRTIPRTGGKHPVVPPTRTPNPTPNRNRDPTPHRSGSWSHDVSKIWKTPLHEPVQGGCGVSPQKQRFWRLNKQSQDGSATFVPLPGSWSQYGPQIWKALLPTNPRSLSSTRIRRSRSQYPGRKTRKIPDGREYRDDAKQDPDRPPCDRHRSSPTPSPSHYRQYSGNSDNQQQITASRGENPTVEQFMTRPQTATTRAQQPRPLMKSAAGVEYLPLRPVKIQQRQGDQPTRDQQQRDPTVPPHWNADLTSGL